MTDSSRDTASHPASKGGTAHSSDNQGSALDRTRETTTKAIDAASEAARRASHSLEGSPLGLLVGGIAVGAVLGALLPRSAKEKELLAPVGARLGTTARAAFAAAKDAGKSELEARGLTRDSAQAQAKELFRGVVKAAGSAGTAAKETATTTGG